MQSVATWLVARPHNAVLALAATLLLPVLHIFSGAIIVLIVLQRGLRPAVLQGAIAGLLLVAVAFMVQAPAAQVAISITATLVPSVLLAWLLLRSRSLTLQVTAIVAGLAMLVFQLAVDDLVAYWQPVIEVLEEWARNNNLQMQGQLLVAEPELAAEMMTLAAVLTRWMLYTIYLLFGYQLYSALPVQTGNFGRFCDLTFGRVIALIMALASVIGFAAGSQLLQDVAIVLFAIFWFQGLAIVHWLHVEGHVPFFVVVATYVLMLVLHVFLILALAVLGYTDAWFGYRRRSAKQQ